MKYLWIIAAILLIVISASTWFAFQRPDFVAGLMALAAGAVWKAIAPAIAKRKPEKEEAQDRQDHREGVRRKGKDA